MKTFTDAQFEKFRNLIYECLGIHFAQAKKDMVQSKIDRFMHQRGLESYDEYYGLLRQRSNKQLWAEFVDDITVHQSGFFRENNHFEFIRSQLREILEMSPSILANNEIKIWSAGCSTGEEPYTLGMVLKEWLPAEIKIRILATDVSAKSLASAQKGVYSSEIKKAMDSYYLMQYFQRVGEQYEVAPLIKELVTFRLFNLMSPFPFRNLFDMIFCRNVMIYFDAPVQQQVVRKFYEVLTRGGLLFIGHSESLINKQFNFKYLQPTVYQKEK